MNLNKKNKKTAKIKQLILNRIERGAKLHKGSLRVNIFFVILGLNIKDSFDFWTNFNYIDVNCLKENKK